MSSSLAPTPFIRIRDLRFRYPGMNHDALWIQTLEIDRAGLVAVTGPSGAGKSTLMELLAGTLAEQYTGSVQVLGKEWSELRGDRARQFHLRRIALIPQDLGLLPNQTPRQMLCQALLDAGVPRNQCDDRVSRALSQMELDAYADRRIAEMSGGQRQRVAIARALVRDVELILADEPTANLNSQLGDETIAVLRRIGETIPVVIVTHDPRVAQFCDSRITLAAPPTGLPSPARVTPRPVTLPAAAAALVMPPPSRVVPAARAVPAAARVTPPPSQAVPAAARVTPPPPIRKVPGHRVAPEPRSFRSLALAGAGAACGVAAAVAALLAGPLSGGGQHPVAQQASVVTPATPAPASSSPAPVATPTADPMTPAPATAKPAVAPVVQAKTATVPRKVVKPSTQPVVVQVAPVQVAPVQTTPVATPVATPSATPTPSYLQWWQSMAQIFGFPTAALTPTPTPTPTPTRH